MLTLHYHWDVSTCHAHAHNRKTSNVPMLNNNKGCCPSLPSSPSLPPSLPRSLLPSISPPPPSSPSPSPHSSIVSSCALKPATLLISSVAIVRSCIATVNSISLLSRSPRVSYSDKRTCNEGGGGSKFV